MFDLNEYFDGKVKSLGFASDKGKATVGVMSEGEYVFSTSAVEHMTLTSGKMSVRLEGEEAFIDVKEGQTFIVPENSSFDVKIKGQASYLCVYG